MSDRTTARYDEGSVEMLNYTKTYVVEMKKKDDRIHYNVTVHICVRNGKIILDHVEIDNTIGLTPSEIRALLYVMMTDEDLYKEFIENLLIKEVMK